MIILGIETSCDETAAAVVENGTKILSSVVASSADMHAKTGGVIPEQAARAQLQSIIPVVQQALLKVDGKHWSVNSGDIEKLKSQNTDHRTSTVPETLQDQRLVTNIDVIAVTVGPGLIGSLLVGVETAKTLSYFWNKPIVPVNHMVGHIYANFISEIPKSKFQNPKQFQISKSKVQNTNHYSIQFPALVLVVSGGHTDLVLMKKHGQLKWVGGTRDDAAGEAFDKTARLLGLGYPGGPAISKQAGKYLDRSPKSVIRRLSLFPRPMIHKDNFDFSFSGLKTSVFNKVKKQKDKETKEPLEIPELSAEIQEAIADVLVAKTLKAVNKFKPKSLLLAGGVAANKRLREKFQQALQTKNENLHFHVPPIVLCTDNASFIASAAYFNYKPIPWEKVRANPQLEIVEKN